MPRKVITSLYSDQFKHKLLGLIGNQKGLCRRQQNLPKVKRTEEPTPKKVPPKVTDDSYLANLVIYLINADDEFKDWISQITLILT